MGHTHRKKSSSSICFSKKRKNPKPKIMSGNNIDMALDDIIKTNKPAKKAPAQSGGGGKEGKGGAKRASNNNQKNGQKNNQRNNANKNMKKSKPQNNQQKSSSSPAKKVRTRPQSRQANQTHNQQSRAGLRPRTAPGKAKTTFARAKAPLAPKKKATGSAPLKNKSVSQKLAIKRLNKARETLQKAVRAVNDANKNLAKQMPAQKQQQMQKKTLPAKQSKQNANAVSQQKKKQAIKRQQINGKVQKQNSGKIQKRSNVSRGDVAIKISNRGPSGRGKGRVNVVRDTLKKEKPATSLDDRFSQLLKSASRTANRNRGGGAGRRVSTNNSGGRGGDGGAKRGGAPKRGGAQPRSNRRY